MEIRCNLLTKRFIFAIMQKNETFHFTRMEEAMRTLLLGIDIGTSGLKTAVFSPEEGLIASVTESYTVEYPHPGWAEQDPLMWWEAVCSSLKRLWQETDVRPEEIVGIGVDGQSWSCIPVDRDGTVLHATPIWIDTRADLICRREEERLGAQRLFSVGQNPFKPSYTTPKLLWFKETLPEIYRNTYKFLQCNSYIVMKLTGEFTQDVCQSYGLHVVDMRTGEYDASLVDELGLDLDKLVENNSPCHQVVGEVNTRAAEQTGLRIGTPVVAGGLDAACGTLGAGVYKAGQTQEQGGQAGGMSICTDSYKGDPALIMSHHVVPDLWLLQGGTVGGGASLNWIVKEIGEAERQLAKEQGRGTFELVSDAADTVAPGSDGLIFLPYLMGERSPIWDANAKGVFFGLGFDKTRAHMYRSVMEGAAYALYHNLEVAEKAGAFVGEMYAMGGSANSLVWTQIKADITGKTIRVPATDTATTLGASILAGVGTGVYKDFQEAVEKNVKIVRSHVPDMALHEQYMQGYAIYRELYEQLKNTMKRL